MKKTISKEIYTNNLTGPRMPKGQFSTQIVTQKLWKDFKKKFPEYKEMSWQTFSSKWSELSATMRKEIIENPLGIKMGSYTGEMKTQYLPFKFPEAINQAISAELGEKTPHVNLVNKGKVAKIKWERRWAVKFNRMLQFLAFIPTRELTKMAKKYIDSDPEKLRMSRQTRGGFRIWKHLKLKGE